MELTQSLLDQKATIVETTIEVPPKCNTLAAILGVIVGGCGALYLCYRWKRYVEKTFTDLNSSVEEVRESVSYIKHRLKTRDCCSCHDQADQSVNDGGHGSDVHHCDKVEFLKAVDELLQSNFLDVEEAYCMLKGRLAENRDDHCFLVRLARAAHTLGLKHRTDDGDCASKKKFLFEAQKYAGQALKLNRHDCDANKWYAITLGSLTAVQSFRQRIQNLPHVKSHVERALQMQPNDAFLHHLLGRWHFEVATMSYLQRASAWLWFGFNERSTLAEARQHFNYSNTLMPLWKDNHLYIARSYAVDGNKEAAIRWAEMGLLLPSITATDWQTEVEIGKLLLTLRVPEDENVDT